jgi:RNA polymerase sigma factor (sigma-70 family)
MVQSLRRSKAEVLEELALQLQPLLHQWHQLHRSVHLDERHRAERLHRLESRMRQIGLPRFHRLLRDLCDVYCKNRRTHGAGAGFEAEVFAEEVLLLILERLPQFDPHLASFSTWLAKHVFLSVYRDLQRGCNPTWAQARPTTAAGLRQHREAFAIARAQSLDAPARSDADNDPFTWHEVLGSVDNAAEKALLEEYCRKRFLQAVLGLSEADQLLLERVHLRGEAKQDVARSLGRTPGRISQKLGEIYRRLAGTLGAQFLEECDGTDFCNALHQRVAGGSAVGCQARLERLSRDVPRLLASSGWLGAIEGPPVELDAAEERLWTHLMAPPAPFRLLALAGVGVAAAAAVALVNLWLRAVVPPPPPELATRSPEPSPAATAAKAPAEAPRPMRKPAAPARPARSASGTARPPQAPPAPQSAPKPVPPPTLPVPTPLLADKPPSEAGPAPGLPATPDSQILPSPQEHLLRGSQSSDDLAVASYSRELCQALQEAGHWPPDGAEPAVVEIALGVGRVGTRLLQPPRTVVAGGSVIDAALVAAIEALAGKGWPIWSEASDRQLRILVIYDSDSQRLYCRAEALP